MKNLLSLLIGILLIASCEVAEVEDLSELTQAEKEAIYDQIQEPRDVSYLLGTVIDTVTMDSIKAQQVIRVYDRSLNNQGAFEVDLALYQCGIKTENPQAIVVQYDFSDGMEPLHLKNVSSVAIENHFEDWWKIDLIVATDTIYGGRTYTNCSQTLYSETEEFLNNSISLYGFNKQEAEFVKEQLDRLIPQLK